MISAKTREEEERRVGPPVVFARHVKVDPVTGHRSRTYVPSATFEASHLTVDAMCQMLGVSLGRLGALTGLSYYNLAYGWKAAGGTARRPSSLFLTRMIWMLRMKYVEGWDFTAVKSIDWPKGVAIFVKQGEESSLAFKSDIPRTKLRAKR